VVCHEGSDAVAAALPAWEACLRARPEALAFSRPAWARAWLSVYGGDGQPCVIEVRRRNQPVGIVPLQVVTAPIIGLRRLEFIGGAPPTWGQWALNPSGLGHSIFNEAVIVPGHEAEVVAAWCRWLERERRRWDVIQLNCLPVGSALAQHFGATSGPWVVDERSQTKHWIDLTVGWETWLTTLSKRQRRHLQYEPHAMQRAAGAPLELHRVAGSAVGQAMEDYLDLVQRRWAAVGRPGISHRDAALYRALAEESEAGLVFFRLTAGGRLLASQFGFDDGSRYLLFGLAFDPSFHHQSPSQVLMQKVIRHCFDDGHREVDFGALRDVHQWVPQSRIRVHLTVRSLRPPARGRAAALGGVARAVAAGLENPVGRKARDTAARVWAGHVLVRRRPVSPPSAVPNLVLLPPRAGEVLVTVVVPTRNSGATLAACLNSLRQQTAPCAVIVVDNQSTDDTVAIAHRYADRVVDAGPERSTQRNLGARLAATPFVGFIDSDMVVSPTVVEEALTVLQGGDGAVIVPEQAVGDGFWAQVGKFEKIFYVGSPSVEAARFFHREVIAAAGGFDESFTGGEDWDLHLRVGQITSVARIHGVISHDESSLRFLDRCAKKAYYAPGLRVFAHKHGSAALKSAVLDRPYVRHPWRLVYPHPLLGAGLVALKSGELVAVGYGFIRDQLRRPS
jgi:CelD/BcsL family acetyltransferase involved in cellulose biosynthesis/GT2 family glycosyltransferase